MYSFWCANFEPKSYCFIYAVTWKQFESISGNWCKGPDRKLPHWGLLEGIVWKLEMEKLIRLRAFFYITYKLFFSLTSLLTSESLEYFDSFSLYAIEFVGETTLQIRQQLWGCQESFLGCFVVQQAIRRFALISFNPILSHFQKLR